MPSPPQKQHVEKCRKSPQAKSPDRPKQNVNKRNKQEQLSPTRHHSPDRRQIRESDNSRLRPSESNAKAKQSPVKNTTALYPTLSTFYKQENLDYSPPEPTADYPYTDDFPINNIYPDLSQENFNENIFENETAVSVIDNTVHQDTNHLHSASNLNINISEPKVLNDKQVDMNESFVAPNISTVIPSAPPLPLVDLPREPSAITAEDMVRPDRNSFQKKCDASKFIDENTPPIKFVDMRAPIKMSYADRVSHFDINNPPKSKAEFEQWMTWRKQVNRHMASMILIKQGKDVYVAPSEINRKPLPKTTMQSVIDKSKSNVKQTSLGGKPYVMYGIPRAKISG